LDDPRELQAILSKAIVGVRKILRECRLGRTGFLTRRQRQCATLLERLGIDLRKLIPLVHRIADLSRRYDELERILDAVHRTSRTADERAAQSAEYQRIRKMTLKSPEGLRRWVS